VRNFVLRHFTRFVAAAALAVGFAGPAHADLLSSSQVRGMDDDSGVTWISVKLTNQTNSPQGATLRFTTYASSGQGEQSVPVPKLPPGTARTLNIPLLFDMQNAMLVADDGTVRGLNLDIYGRNFNGDFREHLLVSSPEMQLTDLQLDEFTRANTMKYGGMPMGGGGTLYPHGVTSGASGSTTAPLMAGERCISQLDVSELPESWLCYVPLKCVFISETQEREISPAQREALDTWVGLGGSLYFFDSESSETIQQGRGTLTRLKENPVLEKTDFMAMPKRVNQLFSGMSVGGMPYVEKDTRGRGFSLVLITIFVIAVGPVNYIYYARRGQIRKLLKTVPAISMAFCGLIAGYFLLTEGFAKKGGSISVTRLDEQTNKAITFAQHFLISGLYPSGGFHFGRETYLRPLFMDRNDPVQATLGKELVITRGLFRPKIPLQYLTIKPHTTRERLLVAADVKSARNGFELPVKAVAVYRDGNYFAGGAAASGGEVALAPTKPARKSDTAELEKPLSGKGDHTAMMLNLVSLLGPQAASEKELEFVMDQVTALSEDADTTSGTVYAVAFDGMPAAVEPGVKITEGKNLHIVLGTAAESGSE
jgi:hypothetical protein